MTSVFYLFYVVNIFLQLSAFNSSDWWIYLWLASWGLHLVLKAWIIEWFNIIGNLPEDDEKQRC